MSLAKEQELLYSLWALHVISMENPSSMLPTSHPTWLEHCYYFLLVLECFFFFLNLACPVWKKEIYKSLSIISIPWIPWTPLLLHCRSLPSDVHSDGPHECRCPHQFRKVTIQLASPSGVCFLSRCHPLDHSEEGSAGPSVLSSLRQCHRDALRISQFLVWGRGGHSVCLVLCIVWIGWWWWWPFIEREPFHAATAFSLRLSGHNHQVGYFCHLWCVLGVFVLP